jgi:hypothetical protein
MTRRKRTDRLYERSLEPHEHEALPLSEQRSGITPMDLAQSYPRCP